MFFAAPALRSIPQTNVPLVRLAATVPARLVVCTTDVTHLLCTYFASGGWSMATMRNVLVWYASLCPRTFTTDTTCPPAGAWRQDTEDERNNTGYMLGVRARQLREQERTGAVGQNVQLYCAEPRPREATPTENNQDATIAERLFAVLNVQKSKTTNGRKSRASAKH